MLEAFLASLVKDLIIWAIGAIITAISAWLAYRRYLKKIEKAKEAEKRLGEANKITNDEERLKEKEDAIADLERSLGGDPDSH